jgi:hypothetical protein
VTSPAAAPAARSGTPLSTTNTPAGKTPWTPAQNQKYAQLRAMGKSPAYAAKAANNMVAPAPSSQIMRTSSQKSIDTPSLISYSVSQNPIVKSTGTIRSAASLPKPTTYSAPSPHSPAPAPVRSGGGGGSGGSSSGVVTTRKPKPAVVPIHNFLPSPNQSLIRFARRKRYK